MYDSDTAAGPRVVRLTAWMDVLVCSATQTVSEERSERTPPPPTSKYSSSSSSLTSLHAHSHLMSTSTPLHLPTHLPYPIKIVAHAVQPSATVQRGTRLLTYSFLHTSKETGQETRFGTWDSPIEGVVDSWVFKLNDTISARRSVDTPAIKITEPCKHEIQLHGLCCVCGKDMTRYVLNVSITPNFALTPMYCSQL